MDCQAINYLQCSSRTMFLKSYMSTFPDSAEVPGFSLKFSKPPGLTQSTVYYFYLLFKNRSFGLLFVFLD